MSYKITLSDGTIIDNLELNGNNFVSRTPLTAANFAGKLAHVTIEGPEDGYGLVGEHGPMMLAENRVQGWPDGYYFVLLDIPPAELERRQTRGDIEYIAMMTGVELEEAE